MSKACLLLCALFPILAHAAYVPTPTESAVLEAILRDEVRAYTSGHDSLIGASLGQSAATADERGEAAAAKAKQAVAKLKSEFADFYLGKPTNVSISTLAINVSMYATLLPIDHGCPHDMAKCWQSIQAVDRSSQRDHALAGTLKRFREAGLDLSPFEAR